MCLKCRYYMLSYVCLFKRKALVAISWPLEGTTLSILASMDWVSYTLAPWRFWNYMSGHVLHTYSVARANTVPEKNQLQFYVFMSFNVKRGFKAQASRHERPR